jgi:hypothetical protein
LATSPTSGSPSSGTRLSSPMNLMFIVGTQILQQMAIWKQLQLCAFKVAAVLETM